MIIDVTELTWLEGDAACTLGELAERSRLTQAEIMELVGYGALPHGEPGAGEQRFPGHALSAARTAARLRDDFEIDLCGVALALTLLRRIEDLECRLRQAGQRSP